MNPERPTLDDLRIKRRYAKSHEGEVGVGEVLGVVSGAPECRRQGIAGQKALERLAAIASGGR